VLTLEQIFYISQSIASLAVVGSLIYLGLQVRNADRSQRAMMQQGRANRMTTTFIALASPELSSVWQKGMDADPTMTREEVAQWMLMCRAGFLSAEDSFLQHQAGALDQAAYDSYCAGVRSFMSHAGFRISWQMMGGQFGKEFRAFIDEQVAASPIVNSLDIFAAWQKLLAAQNQGSTTTRL
jgi:hypothetical protein